MTSSTAHCSAINCKNRQCGRPDLSFFRFPKNKERSQKWVQNTRREDLLNRTPVYLFNNCRLCAEHFEVEQFNNRETRNRLKWNAIPSIFKVPNPPKRLSTPRRPIKRKNTSTSSPLPQKLQKVEDHVGTDHSYCKHTGKVRYNSPASSTRRSLSPSMSSSHDVPDDNTPAKKQNRQLRKERLRTFRLKKRVEHLKDSMNKVTKDSETLKDLIEGAKKFLDESALSFFAAQLKNSPRCRRSRGRRWSHSDKIVALSLYHHGPLAYRFCQSLFTLPSVSSLRRWLSGIEVKPGFCTPVFDLLADKVRGLSEKDKLCAITFDEMSLRAGLSYNITNDSIEGFEDYGTLGKTARPANHALVFMVRGLLGKWKQPVGYFLSRDAAPANKLEELLKECLQRVRDIGLCPKVVISDQGSSNVGVFKKLGVTSKQPYFIDGSDKVFCMHDPPHLLKNMRSNLEKYVFRIDTDGKSKYVRWSHIRNFYEHDSQLPIRKAHKLTKGHFDLNSFSKMRVNKAAQVLSHSVAAGVYTYAALGKLPGEAVHTAEFVEMIDKLFDSFNSRFFRDPKVLKRPLSSKSSHLEFFETCLPILESLRVVGSKNVLFIKGWCLAIACVKQLWEDLKTNHDVKFLFTSRINQDIVENLFATIRRKGGCRDNPSAKEFRCALRMVMVAELIKPSARANCTPDSDKFMVTFNNLTSRKSLRSKHAISVSSWNAPHARNTSYTSVQINLPEKNTLAYIAGYLCRRCLAGHDISARCEICRNALLSDSTDPDLLFIHNKAYNTSTSDYGALMVPTDAFLAFCTEAEQVFREEFSDANMTRNNICLLLNRAIQSLGSYKDMELCSERVKAKIVSTFVSVRVHYALKFKNRQSRSVTVKRKCTKLKKVSHK